MYHHYIKINKKPFEDALKLVDKYTRNAVLLSFSNNADSYIFKETVETGKSFLSNNGTIDRPWDIEILEIFLPLIPKEEYQIEMESSE